MLNQIAEIVPTGIASVSERKAPWVRRGRRVLAETKGREDSPDQKDCLDPKEERETLDHTDLWDPKETGAKWVFPDSPV
jgi:hypothetical protein